MVRTMLVAAAVLAAAGAASLATGQAGGAAVNLLALEFDPDGMLYALDSKAGQVLSLQLPDKKGKVAPVQVPDLGVQLAKLLDGAPGDVLVHDVAVHPASFAVYVSAGKKGAQDSRLFRVGADRKLQEVPVADVKKASVSLPQGTQPFDLAVTARSLVVSSTSQDRTFGSGLHRVSLPLAEGKVANAQTEVYHTSHRAWETKAPLIAVTAYTAGGKDYLVGSTKCTPVVRIPVDEIGDKAKVKTTTIIELGGRNGPVSMLVYGQGPRQTLLVTHQNTATEGAYKVSGAVLNEGSRVNEQAVNRSGLTVDAWKNTKRAALLGPAAAVAVVDQGGTLSLVTLPLP
jgi:hypothetical protein